MSTNTIWAGPSLLTPIYLEALMVGSKNQPGTWAAVAVDYAQLGLRGGQPQPTPFQTSSAPATGIHLQWTPPPSLRNGQSNDQGQIELPLLPNRWLLTRAYIAKPGDLPQYTAWVLESDYLGTQPPGTHAYPDPSGGSTQYYIGRRFELSAWNGGTSDYKGGGFLRAMGPGDVSYIAIYNNMTNVLAFFDDMQGAPHGLYSYSVCGWYEPPSQDPLLGVSSSQPQGFDSRSQWQELMQKLFWTVGDEHDQDLAEADWQAWLQAHPGLVGPPMTAAQQQWPGQNLCHGLLYNLEWKGPDQLYPFNPILNGSNTPQVALGANDAEALAAWLGNQAGSPAAEQMMLAFQQDMIFDYVKNPSLFAERSQAARFGNYNSGSQWVVYQADQESSASQIPAGDASVPLDAQATQDLTVLNASQYQLGMAQVNQVSLQSQLYEAYWKKENYARSDSALGKQIDALIASLTTQVNALAQQVTNLQRQVDAQSAALQTQVQKQNLTLNLISLPRYNQRQDPVVLVAGAGLDQKLSQTGITEDERLLFTRFTGQTISAIHVVYQDGALKLDVWLNSSDFAAIRWPVGVLIPKEMPDFWFETFLLDSNNARLLASTACSKAGQTPSAAQLDALTAQIQRQQAALWNAELQQLLDPRVLSENAGFAGVAPMKLSVLRWFVEQAEPVPAQRSECRCAAAIPARPVAADGRRSGQIRCTDAIHVRAGDADDSATAADEQAECNAKRGRPAATAGTGGSFPAGRRQPECLLPHPRRPFPHQTPAGGGCVWANPERLACRRMRSWCRASPRACAWTCAWYSSMTMRCAAILPTTPARSAAG